MNMIRSILIAIVASAGFAGVSTSGAQAQARSAGFDGFWSVLIVTDKGTCDRAYRYPVRIQRGKVRHADPSNSSFNIGGQVGKGGTVRVFVSRGDLRADGNGRLSRAGSGGKWRSAKGECSGHWTAERRG
jgi:hypothetical protein